MDVDSQSASLLLAVEDKVDMSDSDDCQSDDEGIRQDAQAKNERMMKGKLEGYSPDGKKSQEETDDYHKMKNIEYREYQAELLELARKQNIIVCLPTGSGKTYIALKLTELMLPDAIEKKQKIIFLANSVPLVNQQAKYFSQNLVCTSVKDDQVVRPITGDLNVDIWKQEQWDEVFRSCHILVMSTQILVDALTKAFIRWNQIALIILDECHHAQKSHPMAELMKNYGETYQKFGAVGLPRVLGLTATIIKGMSKAEQISKDITDIERLLCCRAVTHRNYEDVLRQGWTVFLVRTVTSTSEEELLRTYFKNGEVPEDFEVLYRSRHPKENTNEKARYSTSTILQVREYFSDYKIEDKVCAEINQLIQLLDKLPKDFGTEEEISIIERINHPTLTSEEQIYNKNKGVPKTLKSFLNDLLRTYTELGPFCGKLAATLKVIFIVKWIQELENGSEENTYGSDDSSGEGGIEEGGGITILHLIELAKTVLFQFMNNLDRLMSVEAKTGCKERDAKKEPGITQEAWKVRYCVSNKITVLWEILKAKKPSESTEETDKLCGLIFCERRITAQVLRWYLEEAAKQWPNELGFLKPEVMTGHSTIVGDTELARFTAKRQAKIVQQFHKRELNLLVATQVVEEGLNVPSCNLVIRLDSVNTYPSFVQSLGRARKKDAICYALIDIENEPKERNKIQNFISYNVKLSMALESNAIHVGEGDEEDETIVGRYATPIPPFNPTGNPDGPMITATDAISLVHRYCNSLSCDKIAALFPTAWKEESIMEDKRKYFKARVLLPIMSPIREAVEGDWMPDKTLAKRSAYLKCCIRLHDEGELSENLLPKPRSIDSLKCEFLDQLKEKHDEEKKTAQGKIGTRKRTQWYQKKVPAAFTDPSSKIESGGPISVYNIKINLSNYRGGESFKQLYEFERYGKSFGIVTNANLKCLPKFTLKANFGTLDVSIRKCSIKDKTLNKDQIESLDHFQVYLRDAIYAIRNSVLKSDKNYSILIAPLQKISPLERTMVGSAQEIDWQLIQCLLNLDEEEHLLSVPSEQSRKEMQFVAEAYENAVLIPWYKVDVKENPELLCTLRVTEHNAKSDFDDTDKYRTFEEYYGKKYGVQLFHPEYPLIHCKPIAKQLNFLTKKVNSYEMRKELSQRNMVKMVPELMNMHILPASLYVQGRFLPSILHRIYRLLLANEFRLKVAQHFSWMVDEDVDYLEEISDTDSSCGTDEDDGYDDIDGGSLEAALRSMQVGTTNEELDTPSRKQEEKKKRKRNIILLETLNPLTIDWSTILESHDSPERARKSVRDTKYAMPEPPMYKSSVCGDLIDIDKVESYNFDTETDFSVETGPTMETIMEAFTLSNAQDCIDLEKLETMGDSALKLIVSLHVFLQFPRWDEGKMTQMRMKLISNLHLYQLAKEHQLAELISGSIFIPDKSWLPVGFEIPETLKQFVLSKGLDYGDLRFLPESILQNDTLLEDHLSELRAIARRKRKDVAVPHTTYTHSHIGDKSVADCMEAIIGAYYVNGGIDGVFRIMEYLGMRGPKLDGSVTNYSRDSIMKPIEPDRHLVNKHQKIIPFLNLLEETICYKFKNPWTAVEALTHPTYMGNRETYCYERLEYVGDAILDFLVTNYILTKTNITDPGEITDLRAALVNNVTFGSLAVKYGFHTFLKYDSEPLKQCIEQFAQYQDENDHKVSDPFKLLSDFECPTVREIEVPKVLGDVFESIAGAVFVDSGMSIDTVWKVFYRLMKKEMEEFSKKTPKSPLRELYEQYPGKVKFCKYSEESNSANPKSKQHIQSKYQTVYLKLKIPGCDEFVRGIGSTIKQAKQAAAKYIVRKLKDSDAGI